MQKLKSLLSFIFDNRRIIGLIVGSSLTLAGFPEHGDFLAKIGEIE